MRRIKEGEKHMEDLNKNLEVINALKQTFAAVKKEIRCQYKDDNLTGPQGMLMGILAHHGEMKISDLSEKLHLSNSTVSGIVDRLENLELVERIRSKEDRRVVYVNITPKYKEVAAQRFKEIEQSVVSKMSKASQEELDKVIEGLNILKRLLE